MSWTTLRSSIIHSPCPVDMRIAHNGSAEKSIAHLAAVHSSIHVVRRAIIKHISPAYLTGRQAELRARHIQLRRTLDSFMLQLSKLTWFPLSLHYISQERPTGRLGNGSLD